MKPVKGGRADKEGKKPSPDFGALDSFKEQSYCSFCGHHIDNKYGCCLYCIGKKKK